MVTTSSGPVVWLTAGSCAIGSVNVNRLPRFSPSLSARTTPPCSSTSRRTIASPRPEPPWRRCSGASTW